MPASFLSRGDTILRRQGRSARARRIAELAPECPQDKTLNIILEEDESHPSSRSTSPSASSSRSGYSSSSQNLALKARRRHANVSDIRVARGMPTHDSSDFFALQYDAPRAAPSPPLSAQSSYDSFRLAFEDVAPQFPSPPGFCEPQSPTSSTSSSPCSRDGGMPLTPSTSDEEGSFVNPYYVEIQPLVINKHNQKLHEVTAIEHPVALPEAYDSDSDSEWYTRELSKSITLRTPSFRLHKISRPDSIISAPPASKRRMSKTSPSPSPPPRPDSSKRQSVRRSVIPNYPPPPPPKCDPRPPSISSTASLVDFPMHSHPTRAAPKAPQVPVRPPPRSSVPAESVFEDDAASAFSFSIYEVDLGDARSGSSSSASAYSQPSFDAFAAHDVAFDLDGGMMLPVSLPATPNDVDELTGWDDEVEFVFDEEEEVKHSPVFPPSPAPSPPRSYYPSYSPSAPSPPAPAQHAVYMEEHTLKSKWSSSTLASVQQEHARRGPSAKLRLYFGGSAGATPKRGSAQSSTSKKGVPATPTSPFGSALGLMSPRRSGRAQAHARGNSEAPVLGYGATVGVRRRGSVATMSDTGSEQSFSSTSSSGLRRKPIPIEMFLRS